MAANSIQEAALVSNHKCQLPLRLPYSWPLGLDVLIKVVKADRNGTLLHLFVNEVERLAYTIEKVLLGDRSIDTFEPQNLEAILSTQFRGK